MLKLFEYRREEIEMLVAEVGSINPDAVKPLLREIKKRFSDKTANEYMALKDISLLFAWSTTKEGHKFWQDLHNRILTERGF